MKPKLIMLGAAKQVGKDTFFNILDQLYPHKFYRLAFADALKNDLNDISKKMFGKYVAELNQEEKEILRPVMIEFGCAFRKIDPLHWVKIVHKQISDVVTPGIPIISDGRFGNEVEYFKNIYGDECIFVEINRIGAPEPTNEEKKNIPLLAKYVDCRLTWQTANDNLDELKPYVVKFYNKYFKE